MATVILSENRMNPNAFLCANGAYSQSYLSANTPGAPQLLSRSFIKNFVDGLGDVASNVVRTVTNATGAGADIVKGVGTGVSGYVSNPDNIAQIGGAVATGLTGMPVNLTNAQGQQQNFMPQNQNPLEGLLRNPLVLVGGLALVYFIASKK